jgi:trehalose/maltose hydrolase-like predicted phosphorylase
MSAPISPPPVTSTGRDELPAYVSNGLVGLRVLDIPLLPGVVLVNGFTGLHPVVEVEAAANAPYPLAGDIGLNNVWLTTAPQQAEFVDQHYDFAVGELRTRFRFRADGSAATVEVLTFCSQKQPTIVVQEIAVEVDRTCELALRAIVDISRLQGRLARRTLKSPGKSDTTIDGSLCWESLGGKSRCGVAYATEFLGDGDVKPQQLDWGLESGLGSQVAVQARPGRRYRLRQIASMVPSSLHKDPDREATRLVARAADAGFDELRTENHVEWNELWKGRIVVDADDDRWQQLADAAYFYLNTSVHPSAPSSTSIYGLAQWNDYHYYYGHVMWDIETFCVPPLLFCQPDAARSLLEYRTQTIGAARSNAKVNGRRGLQFPWEAGPLHGEEASPGEGRASWHEDHVSADVALAFAQYAHATGDDRFLREDAAPVLYGVADWIASRVSRTQSGFAVTRSMGIAEKKEPSDNEAFTIMSARLVLREAITCAERLGHDVPSAWEEVFEGLRPPLSSTGALTSHDGFHPNEEKGATPGPLAGLFPLWYEVEPGVARRTIDYYLKLAPAYIGSPMLSAFYGVWAAWNGDRVLSARLLDEGYAQLIGGRFLQTLEQSPSKFPDKPRSGPFFANLGGFLTALYQGFPGIKIGPGGPGTWPARPVVLPAGWRSIEVERAWVGREPARIEARHGAERATIEVRRAGQRRGRAA